MPGDGDGPTQFPGAVFALHRRLRPRSGMPSSTRVFRLGATHRDVLQYPPPIGGEVERCVVVSVYTQTTFLAAVNPRVAGKFGFYFSA